MPASSVGLRGLRHHRGALAALVVAVTWATWPLGRELVAGLPGVATSVPGHPQSDAADHVWGYVWWVGEVAHGRLPVQTTRSHWPTGGSLWFVDPLGAVLASPILALGDALRAATWRAFVGVLGGALGMYVVAYQWTRARSAAVFAAIVFATSPYILSLLHSGTFEYLELAALPVVWAAARRAFARGGAAATVFAGTAWAWAAVGAAYHGAFAAVLVALAAWEARGEGAHAVLRRLVGVSVVCALLAGPVLSLAWTTLHAPDAVVRPETAPGWNWRQVPVTDLLTLVRPGDHVFPDMGARGNFGIRHVSYLGWIALVFSGIGAWRERRLRVPLVVTLFLAAGPALWIDGAPVPREGALPLPAMLLYGPYSPFRLVHHPFRFVVLAMVVIAMGAAVALRRRPVLAVLATVACLLETTLASPATWPVPVTRVESVVSARAALDAAQRSRDAAVGGRRGVAGPTAPPQYPQGVWSFPPFSTQGGVARGELPRRWELVSAALGTTMPYGVNSLLPSAFADNCFSSSMMACIAEDGRTHARAVAGRDGEPPDPVWRAPPRNCARDAIARDRAAFAAWGYDLVLLDLDSLDRTQRACTRAVLEGGAEVSVAPGPVYEDRMLEAWRVAP